MQDFLVFAVILLIIAIVSIVAFKIMGAMNTDIQASNFGTAAKDLMQDHTERYVSIFDYMFLGIVVLLMITIFMGFFWLDTNPAFYFIAIVLMAIMLIPLAIFSNTFEVFSDSSSIVIQSSAFSIIPYLMTKLPYVFGGLGFVGLVVLFAKIRGGR